MKNILLLFLFAIGSGTITAQQLSDTAQLKKATAFADAKDYKNAALAYSIVLKGSTTADPDDVYNAACAWSMAGNTDTAFYYLGRIVGLNYFNYDHLLADSDLVTLHPDPRWKPLLNKIKQARLHVLTVAAQQQDFDLLVSAMKEAHTGLYWYNSKPAFDSICAARRALIHKGINELDFYNIVAPLIGFAKEGHTYLHLGPETQSYMRFSGKYFPFYIKVLSEKVYLINDLGNYKTKGMLLSTINGHPIEEIMQKFMSYEPSDGFNTTSKYRWIEKSEKFNFYYSRAYPQTDFFDITVTDPVTHASQVYKHIAAVSYDESLSGYKSAVRNTSSATPVLPATFNIDTALSTATLTFNTFDSKRYRAAKIDFHAYVKDVFAQIQALHIKNLVLDIRNNGGGKEGYEDYVLSFMINKDYTKYKYVQLSAFTYSFYQYTDYKPDWQSFDTTLREEHYLEKDGRILRKPGIEPHEKPQPQPFLGNIYVLTSGLTYSGGSEFAALVKNYTNAKFIGEEVGGGYYGNTSGFRIVLTLPHSKLDIGIPILKFVLDTPKDSIPFGHGVLPDYPVQPGIDQYLKNEDAEMIFTRLLIKK